MPISESVRRNIIRTIRAEDIVWSGNLDEVEFLSRIYDLDTLPSSDNRYENARGDIMKHRICNYDWPKDWVFDDPRFDLITASDEEFLRFLCEMIHPTVRPENAERNTLLNFFNEQLKTEGYEIVETKTRFGNIRYVPKGILPNTINALQEAKDIADHLNSEHLQRQIVRMTSAVEKDPELAIGTAKEFIETFCKTILTERGVALQGIKNLPKLFKMTIEEVKPFQINMQNKKTEEILQRTIGSLFMLNQCISELRNLYGTGHGKKAKTTLLETRHAALAVNAATTLALFLYQCHEKTK